MRTLILSLVLIVSLSLASAAENDKPTNDEIAKELGLSIKSIIGVDLQYYRDGRFVMERHKKGADSTEVVRRAKKLLNEDRIEAADGGYYEIRADTLLIHGDNPSAIENLRVLRSELERAGVKVSAFGGKD